MDVSTFQKTIDYNRAKASGIEFVIPRSGYAKKTDAYFVRNVQKAKEAGVAIPGVYHFSYALSDRQAAEEAEYAVGLCKSVGLGPETIIFYDFEYDSVEYCKKCKATINKGVLDRFARAFLNKVKELGYRGGVYLNIDYYKNWYYQSLLNSTIVWLADYTGGPNYPCAFQQYSSTGSVPGIVGNVDMNWCYDESLLRTEQKAEKPTAAKSKDVVIQEVIDGLWGNGDERKAKLSAAGYDPVEIQNGVNAKLNQSSGEAKLKEIVASRTPTRHDASYSGMYNCPTSLNMRDGPGLNHDIIRVLKEGAHVQCFGYHCINAGDAWLYVQADYPDEGKRYIGFVKEKFLKKV